MLHSHLVRLASVALFSFCSIACINTVELAVPPKNLPAALWELSTAATSAERPSAVLARAIREFQPPGPAQLATARQAYRHFAADFPRRPSSERRVGHRNDYAAALIFLGRIKEAIGELEVAEQLEPGYYGTAANLGTAFELAGNLSEARRWILEGITRDPEDHLGTEWLHVAIIDAKLKLQSDPDWLRSHSVLELQAPRDAAEAFRAITYQLNERLNFVSAHDAVVADLFFQAGRRATDAAVRDYLFAHSLRFGDLRQTEIEQVRNAATES